MLLPVIIQKHANRRTKARRPDVRKFGFLTRSNNIGGANKQGESIIPYSRIKHGSEVRMPEQTAMS